MTHPEPDPSPGVLRRLTVVGAGYMGGGIAQTFAAAGYAVALVDADAELAERAVERLVGEAWSYVHDGLWESGAASNVESGLSAAASLELGVARADYVTEAVPEQRELKLGVLARIAAAAPARAVIGTNTSAISIHELAVAVSDPSRFLGVHWFNPAPFIPLVEVVGDGSVADRVEELLRTVGKTPVRVPDVPGFLANRLQLALYREAVAIVEEGLASAADVDRVVTGSFGRRLGVFGPIAVGDLAGLDVYLGSFATLEAHYGPRFAAPASLRDRVENGDLGVKTGGGFRAVQPADRGDLAAYRDRALAAMTRLTDDLGAPPGIE